MKKGEDDLFITIRNKLIDLYSVYCAVYSEILSVERCENISFDVTNNNNC